MFDVLREIEGRILNLISAPTVTWKSKKIDYTPPVVDRIFTDYLLDGVLYRVYLHRIYPCDRAFFHPHPWPSAIRVIGGQGSRYEMGVGFGANDRHDPPPIAATLHIPSGGTYQMVHRDGWHYVKILGAPSVSLMVSGPVWERDAPRTERHTFRELTPEEKDTLLDDIYVYYSGA